MQIPRIHFRCMLGLASLNFLRLLGAIPYFLLKEKNTSEMDFTGKKCEDHVMIGYVTCTTR